LWIKTLARRLTYGSISKLFIIFILGTLQPLGFGSWAMMLSLMISFKKYSSRRIEDFRNYATWVRYTVGLRGSASGVASGDYAGVVFVNYFVWTT
jgi:hypothetical protein